MDELPEFLIGKDQLRAFVEECRADIKDGVNGNLVKDGERLAANFRKLFPDVSDKDLGTILIVFCKVLAGISECPASKLSQVLFETTGPYCYAAADIMGHVLDVDDMTS